MLFFFYHSFIVFYLFLTFLFSFKMFFSFHDGLTKNVNTALRLLDLSHTQQLEFCKVSEGAFKRIQLYFTDKKQNLKHCWYRNKQEKIRFVKTAFTCEILCQIFLIYGMEKKIYCKLLMNWRIFRQYNEIWATKSMFFNKLLYLFNHANDLAAIVLNA